MQPKLRQSVAAFALIRREDRGADLWLAQWNKRWQCYNFVGGHKRPDESFRECVVREVNEELQLNEGQDFTVPAEPMAHLQYVDWSASAREDTAYTVELFEVELIGLDAHCTVNADSSNRWITLQEIESGRAADDRPISSTMKRLIQPH